MVFGRVISAVAFKKHHSDGGRIFKMLTPDEMHDMQQYVANVAITASTLRNLGGPGFVKTARDFLAALDLHSLPEAHDYPTWLDTQTEILREQFCDLPPFETETEKESNSATQSSIAKPLWGPARKAIKAINVFMVMASLNRFLQESYPLTGLEDALEVPLDSVVVGKLKKYQRDQTGKSKLHDPKGWNSIKDLDPTDSAKYQNIADNMAKQRGIPRGRLDVALWEPTERVDCTLVTRCVPEEVRYIQN